VACVCGRTAAHYIGAMTVGGARGITDPINLPLLHVLAKIESLAANKRHPMQPGCDLSTVMTSASKGAIWRPDGAIFARDHPIAGENRL
jgi:hypothetical protein